MTTVVITDEPMSLDDLLAVVQGAQVETDDTVQARMVRSRAVVDHALSANDAVYGLTTQVGHGRNTRLTEDEIRSQQMFLIMSHGGGVGPALRVPLVRAAMAARLNGLARGGSGASPAAADVLVAMLNHAVHPVVPGIGSVGAGDLPLLAGIAQVAVGMGRAVYREEILPGGEALARAGIEPLAPSGKDGLALISANAVSIGHAALVVGSARRLAQVADVAAALSMEALAANPSILHPAVATAKAIPGQTAAMDHLRRLLDGGTLVEPGSAHSVQDALSVRVVPQVHGALRHFVAALDHAVVQELNAASDNPLVSSADQTVISNGNFHPMVMAIAADALRIAVTHVGQLSERRMAHLWEAFFAQLESGQPPVVPAGLGLRYPAAAVVSELKHLAAPATLDTPPQDLGIEDHSTGAPLTVRLTDRSLDLLEDLLAIEMLLARDVLVVAKDPRPRLGRGTSAALEMVEQAVTEGSTPDTVHRAVKHHLADGCDRLDPVLRRGQQLLAVGQSGAHPSVTAAQLDLGGVDPVPGGHVERRDAAPGQQPVEVPDAAVRDHVAVVHVGQQRGDRLHRVGLVGADHSGGATLDPAGDVLPDRELAVADHPALGVRHPAGGLVVRDAGQGQPAVAHRPDHQLGLESPRFAGAHHQAVGVDRGRLHLDRPDPSLAAQSRSVGSRSATRSVGVHHRWAGPPTR